MADLTEGNGRHAGQPVLRSGPPPERAGGALILVHGRGGDPGGMIDLARHLVGPDVACVAPRAAGNVWYPHRFIEPVSINEPDLSSALSVIVALRRALIEAGVNERRIALAGFSQGACLSLEFTRRLGGFACVLGFSGGLIGSTAGEAGDGDLTGLPVLLGCSEGDPHIPLARVHATQAVLRAMGADVTTRIAPGSGHEVTAAEAAIGRTLLARMVSRSSDMTPSAGAA